MEKKGLIKHGNSANGIRTPEYRSWESMKARCRNPNYSNYKYYGGRGISYCKEWEVFQNFLDSMGKRPSKQHSLERINNNGNYEPSNCKWASKCEQMLNRSNAIYLTLNGVTMPIREWASKLGIPLKVLKSRRGEKWSDERILTQPVRRTTLT